MKDFIWFTYHSWLFMKGQRKEFFQEFWPSWGRYKELLSDVRAR